MACLLLCIGTVLLCTVQDAFTSPPAAPRALRFIHFPSPPYNVGTYGANCTGIAPALCKEIFAALGTPIEYSLYPMDMLRGLLQRDEADGMCILQKTPEREALLAFSEPLFDFNVRLYHTASSPSALAGMSLDLVRNQTVGVLQQYAYADATVRTLTRNANRLVAFPTTEILLRTLAAGGIHCAISSEAMADSTLANEPALQRLIHKSPHLVAKHTAYLAISRNSTAVSLLPRINAIIRQLQQNGTMDALLQQSPST